MLPHIGEMCVLVLFVVVCSSEKVGDCEYEYVGRCHMFLLRYDVLV